MLGGRSLQSGLLYASPLGEQARVASRERGRTLGCECSEFARL